LISLTPLYHHYHPLYHIIIIIIIIITMKILSMFRTGVSTWSKPNLVSTEATTTTTTTETTTTSETVVVVENIVVPIESSEKVVDTSDTTDTVHMNHTSDNNNNDDNDHNNDIHEPTASSASNDQHVAIEEEQHPVKVEEEAEQQTATTTTTATNDEQENVPLASVNQQQQSTEEEQALVDSVTTTTTSTIATTGLAQQKVQSVDSTSENQEDNRTDVLPSTSSTSVVAPVAIQCVWRELFDASTNRPYYYNDQTLLSVWDKPAELCEYESQLAKQLELNVQTNNNSNNSNSSDSNRSSRNIDQARLSLTNNNNNNSRNSSSNNSSPSQRNSAVIRNSKKRLSQYDEMLAMALEKRKSTRFVSDGVLHEEPSSSSMNSDGAADSNQALIASMLMASSPTVEALILEDDKNSRRQSQRRSMARMHVRSSSTDQILNDLSNNNANNNNSNKCDHMGKSRDASQMTLPLLSIPSFGNLDMASSSSNASSSSSGASGELSGSATTRAMSSKELRNHNLQRVNNDKRRSTILNHPVYIPNSVRHSPSTKKRPTSTAFLFNQIPLKCTGKNTLVTYGQAKFQQHRKGLFRTVVPTNKMLLFTKDKLKDTLHEMSREAHTALCLTFFDLVQLYMLDRKYKDLQATSKEFMMKQCQFSETDSEKLTKDVYDADVKLAKAILTICLNEVVIRNECMILLCKQCNGNPNPTRAVRGLQLLALFLTAFPPTLAILQEAVCHFLQVLPLDPRATDEMRTMCTVAEKRLRRSVLTGPRKSMLSDTEFRNMTHREKATIEPSVFGVTIEEYVNWQNEHILDQANEHNNDPVILVILSEAIERLGGFETEGIFRLPGHTQQVEQLRDELAQLQLVNGKKQMVIGSWVKDPHVCASVFKLWLRELADPIIPDAFYQKAVDSSQNFDACLDVAKQLPDDNRIILNFVVHFLSRLSEEAVIKQTKMTIENLAVVFAPNILRSKSTDPMTIMKNSNNEKQFVKTLVAANVEAAKRGELLMET